MHAFRCALSLVSLVFGEVLFAGSASLHDWFLHFLESAFSVTCLGAFLRGDGMKGSGEWGWSVDFIVLKCLLEVNHGSYFCFSD